MDYLKFQYCCLVKFNLQFFFFSYLDEEQIPISIFDYNCVMPELYRIAYYV